MVLKSSERRIEHPPQTGMTEHEYMRGRGASGGLAGASNHEIKLTPKTGTKTDTTDARFRLIVDD